MDTLIMDDERRDTTSPAEPTPGRARLRDCLASAALVGALVLELVATVAAWEFAIAMSRLADPSGATGGYLAEVLRSVALVAVGAALAGWAAVLVVERMRRS